VYTKEVMREQIKKKVEKGRRKTVPADWLERAD
jgi:hypothetical protein